MDDYTVFLAGAKALHLFRVADITSGIMMASHRLPGTKPSASRLSLMRLISHLSDVRQPQFVRALLVGGAKRFVHRITLVVQARILTLLIKIALGDTLLIRILRRRELAVERVGMLRHISRVLLMVFAIGETRLHVDGVESFQELSLSWRHGGCDQAGSIRLDLALPAKFGPFGLDEVGAGVGELSLVAGGPCRDARLSDASRRW